MFSAVLLAALFSFIASFCGCRFLRAHAGKIGLLDRPGHRKIHETSTPIGGGLAIWGAIMLVFALGQLAIWILMRNPGLVALPEQFSVHIPGLWARSGNLWILLGLGSCLVVLGTLDDRFGLGWKIRIFVQTIIAIIAVSFGWRATIFLDHQFLTSALSVIWIVGLINSFNMLDNMNGLSAGVAAICAGFLCAVMFLSPNPGSMEPQWFIACFLCVLIGAIGGFLCFNNPFRGSIFMGDGGAYLIGFLLATTTLGATFASYEDLRRQTIFVPLCILAVPLYDTFSVIFIRLHAGRSPFEGDQNHYSHRLVELGLSPPFAVMTIYLSTAVSAVGALLLYRTDFHGAILIVAQIVLVLALIAILESTGRRRK